MTPRQQFCLEQREKYPVKEEILSPVPDFVEIGNRVHIARNVTFAPFGFGYELIEDNLLLIPHTGKIIIEDDVYIHEGTVIVRATHGVTLIGKGTKIDTMVHIAHNVIMGRNNLIVSGTVIGGSVTIGNNCFLGIGCKIRNKINIGNGVTIGMGAVVVKNVSDGQTVKGNPAK